MEWKEYLFEATIALPNKEPYKVELSLENNSYFNALEEAKQMVIKEEKLSAEQEQHIALSKV